MNPKPSYEELSRKVHELERAEARLRESEERARRAAEVNRTMAELGRIINSTLSIAEVYEQFATAVKRIIPFDRAMIALINEGKETWTKAYSSGIEIEGRQIGDVHPLIGLVGRVFRKRSGDILHLKDEREVARDFPLLLPSFRAGLRSMMAAPLVSKDQVIGVLHFSSFRPGAYTEADVTLAEDVAGQIAGAVANVLVHTRVKRAEEALRRSESEKTLILNSTSEMISFYDPDLRFVWSNRVSAMEAGRKVEELVGLHCYEIWHKRAEPCTGCPVIKARDTGQPQESEVRTPDGRYWALHGYPVLNEDGEMVGLIEVDRDITKRKKAEEEKERLQAQLIQAQKMESVGRLAGGVAHDFNNMLGIIIGNAEMTAMQVDPVDPLYQNLQEILKASRRSADTVRQLLAFARRQTISPKVLDLNDTVSGMLKMLRRLIGEDIDLIWAPGKNLGNIRVDPSQVNQILANLAVNSRDAIQGVGRITIESANVVFDESYCRDHEGCLPGEYVLLAVSDTGVGMSREVMERLFDPFFTTKEVGKGTGLGLATIYGIVKQNNGFIDVRSEPGEGSSFKIYFPRCDGESVPVREKVESKIPRGTETVLIAEDEAPLLNIARDILTTQGYTVLAARTPKEALALSGTHAGRIHLLLTDVVMPEMNGRQLTETLRQTHPGLKCLFMSGYTANVVAHHGVLDEGVHFIEKPFSPKFLAEKVRVVLDSSDS